MIIETDNKELLIEYLLEKILIDEDVLPYFTNQKQLNINYSQQSYDLFNDSLTVSKLENLSQNNIKSDQFYWVEKLSLEDKKILKKNNLESITLKKITKNLKTRILKELNFESHLQDFNSYYDLIEEEYLFSLGGFRKKQENKILFFTLGLKNLDQFYKNINDDEFQMFLSLIFSKAIKQNNLAIAHKIMIIDRITKSSNNLLTNKNVFGANMMSVYL